MFHKFSSETSSEENFDANEFLEPPLMQCGLLSHAQIAVPLKIDTSQTVVKKLYLFVDKVMNQDTINNKLWNPKYAHKEYYNYNRFIDWIWRSLPPKKIKEQFNTRLVELQSINDTLAYFKLEISNNDTSNIAMFNVYKFYIVTINGKYYLDNCKDYDAYIFKKIETENIIYYISPFFKIPTSDLIKANQQFDSLCAKLDYPKPKSKIAYYMCSNEQEMNILCNIVIWNGGVGGFTNMEDNYVVALSNKPFYAHEFIHAILGKGAPCFFLGEGIASLYGGLSKDQTYHQGIVKLKKCYALGKCNFDNLYERKIHNTYHNTLTYAFAGVFCQWLIAKIGIKKFYRMYYNQAINTKNFIEKVVEITGEKEEKIRKEIEELIKE